MNSATSEVLSAAEWRPRAEAHRLRLGKWVEAHRGRRARAQAQPVVDFLFTYYSHRPGRLLRWSPGHGIALEDAADGEFERDGRWTLRDGVARLDIRRMGARQRRELHFVNELMAATAARPGRFGCSGLHEWAMLYRQEEARRRHDAFPLRLPVAEIEAVVESQPICCSHYDAFRFFTPPARAFNSLQPGHADRLEQEQPGCLHTNMDLYKWCYKLSPWIPSELVADAFVLAAEIRELDMRASPYDLSALGYPPVKIETPEGRAEYEREQRQFSRRAEPLRARLGGEARQLVRELQKL